MGLWPCTLPGSGAVEPLTRVLMYTRTSSCTRSHTCLHTNHLYMLHTCTHRCPHTLTYRATKEGHCQGHDTHPCHSVPGHTCPPRPCQYYKPSACATAGSGFGGSSGWEEHPAACQDPMISAGCVQGGRCPCWHPRLEETQLYFLRLPEPHLLPPLAKVTAPGGSVAGGLACTC